MPGRVDNPLSAGPHQLIRDGAILAACLDDLLNGLGPLPIEAHEPTLFEPPSTPDAPAPKAPVSADIGERQKLILDHLGVDGANVDLLMERTGLDASVILQELTFLTLKGLVKRIDGQTFARKR